MSEVLAVTLNSLFERVKYAVLLILSLRVHIYMYVCVYSKVLDAHVPLELMT